MAEGFLDTCNVGNGRSIEDIADEYFENLVWSSFLDGAQKSLLGDIKTCKMHDLVHDLAKDVAGDKDELVSIKVSELNVTSKIRRLQLTVDADLSSSSFLKSSSKLRTVFIPEGSKLDPFMFSENNQYLRILHMEGGSPSHSAQPKWRSLSVLKHLRYLRLSHLNLREVVYDQSIGKLYNLETLVLRHMGVEIQILLSNIQSLRKLRYLEISNTDMVELPDSVKCLSNLQTLDLTNCELKYIPDSISGLRFLRFLNLSDNPFEKLPPSVVTLSDLETLDVNTCKNLKALPESVRGLAKLRVFDFKNCPLLKELPDDFGALAQLRYFRLDDTQIHALPESCANLSNLEYVSLFHCEVPKYVKNWAKLRVFNSIKGNILGAGELVFLDTLSYYVPKKYTINEAEHNIGIEELRNLSFLEELVICNLQNVEDPMDAERANLKGKQNLRLLCLHWDVFPWFLYPNHRPAEVFEALQPPPGLRQLLIANFMGQVFPRWMCVPSGLPNVVRLDLCNCRGIETLPDIGGFPSLIQLVLSDCKSLREISWFSLMILELKRVDQKLVWSVGRSQMTSLTELCLENIEDLIYFPVSILQNNSNLQILTIKGCNQLKGFGVTDDDNNENVDAMHGSLRILQFLDCPVFKFLPDLRGWTSLRKLIIFDFPQVKESLTYDLKSLSFLRELYVDFIQRDEEREDPSTYTELINLMNR